MSRGSEGGVTRVGAVYLHTGSGNHYIVTSIAVDKSTAAGLRSDDPMPMLVLYRLMGTTGPVGVLYARPEREFHEVLRFQVDEEGDRFESLPRFQVQP